MDVSCAVCGNEIGPLKRCGQCKSVYYCSVKHQVADWPDHKPLCFKQRKLEQFADPTDEAGDTGPAAPQPDLSATATARPLVVSQSSEAPTPPRRPKPLAGDGGAQFEDAESEQLGPATAAAATPVDNPQPRPDDNQPLMKAGFLNRKSSATKANGKKKKKKSDDVQPSRRSVPISPENAKPPPPLQTKPMTIFKGLDGAALIEEELDLNQSMSKFYPEYFPKNLHYACTYWDEHRQNFGLFLRVLLDHATLCKLHLNSVDLTMQFNARYGDISSAKMGLVQLIYTRLGEKIIEKKENFELILSGIIFFFDCLRDVFDSFEENPDPKYLFEQRIAPRLKTIFLEASASNQRRLFIWTQRLLKENEGFDENDLLRFFWPQFILYILRFFDIYDSSTQQKQIKDLIKQHQTEHRASDGSGDGDDHKKLQFMAQFGQKTFWDKKYRNIDHNAPFFDWYVSFKDVKGIFRQYVMDTLGGSAKSKKLLYLGCGQSRLLLDFSEHYSRLSSTEQCTIKHMKGYTGLEGVAVNYRKMDISCLDFPDKHFHFVVEKATLDSLKHGPSPTHSFSTAVTEVHRVLKPGGIFLTISLTLFPLYAVEGFCLLESFKLQATAQSTSLGDEKQATKKAVHVFVSVLKKN